MAYIREGVVCKTKSTKGFVPKNKITFRDFIFKAGSNGIYIGNIYIQEDMIDKNFIFKVETVTNEELNKMIKKGKV